jgi:hypothetical protein
MYNLGIGPFGVEKLCALGEVFLQTGMLESDGSLQVKPNDMQYLAQKLLHGNVYHVRVSNIPLGVYIIGIFTINNHRSLK